jgi:hypothetical protein
MESLAVDNGGVVFLLIVMRTQDKATGAPSAVTRIAAKCALLQARTLLAVADRVFGSIATDFEQFLPRDWSFAARGIVGEVRRR